MSSIITTKLYIPSVRTRVIHRTRLIERLNYRRQLTLISAPAGFGKTTLLSAWLANSHQPVTWLSLDEGDNDPSRFMIYMIAALQKIAPQIVASEEDFLVHLVNDVARIEHDFVLVLDDYHMIENHEIDQMLAFLIDHAPPQMQIVIATREDPTLPLARLRARAQLTELRAHDLRFSQEETAAFLQEMTGITFSSDDVAALEARTEGWIAGLQMAALSMQGRDDTANFIQSFTGSHRFVLDYLVEEVLQHQPEEIRKFLLQTSILNRLSGALCDSVTQQSNSRKMLETLERDNLFVIMLDDNRQWYRYHHLFADALQAHLMNEYPDLIHELQLRASQWYVKQDLMFEAIHHALAAQDFDYAADLIESVWAGMDENYQLHTWIKWVKSLPEATIKSRPTLSLGYAWALLNHGELDAAEARLKDAEVLDDGALPAAIASARAYGALTLGNIADAVIYAKQALEYSSDTTSHRQAVSLLGLTYWASGDLIAADEALEAFMIDMWKQGYIHDAIGMAFILGDIRLTLGNLQGAFAIYEQFLPRLSEPFPLGAEDIYRGIAALYLERGDLNAAEYYLSLTTSLNNPLPNWQHRLLTTQARMQTIQGNFDAALELINQAEAVFIRTPLPDVRPTSAQKVRVWIKQGTLNHALMWANQLTDSTDYVHEYEQITLARLYLAQGFNEEASALLARLYQAAEESGRIGSLIEILILQAVAKSSVAPLKQALMLAKSQGYVRLFVDEGTSIMRLLTAAISQGIEPDYAQHLLNFFPSAAPSHDVDALSERELEILRYMAQGLTNPEIADRLYISNNTVKVHSRNIYSKLDAHNRTQAITKARALGILSE